MTNRMHHWEYERKGVNNKKGVNRFIYSVKSTQTGKEKEIEIYSRFDLPSVLLNLEH